MIIYKASSGNEYNFYGATMRVTEGTLHKYKWTPNAVKSKFGEAIKEFRKEAAEYEITLNFKGELSDRKRELDKLREDFERDILTKKPGRIYFNSYYVDGYCIESDTGVSKIKNTWSENKIIFYCPFPFWIKETTYQYLPEPPETVKYTDLETGILFPEFPFDFAPVRGEKILENPSFADSNFIMTIYGFAESPQVSIAGHPYRVETTIYEGERLVIDSKKGTVKKIGRLGEVVDCYNARQKDYSVFKKIPAGLNVFQWSGGFGVDIVLFDERSEPKWSL